MALACSPGGFGHGTRDPGIACAGDVNADGYRGVIVGAPSWGNGQTDKGQAFLYLGTSTSPIRQQEGSAAGASWVEGGRSSTWARAPTVSIVSCGNHASP